MLPYYVTSALQQAAGGWVTFLRFLLVTVWTCQSSLHVLWPRTNHMRAAGVQQWRPERCSVVLAGAGVVTEQRCFLKCQKRPSSPPDGRARPSLHVLLGSPFRSFKKYFTHPVSYPDTIIHAKEGKKNLQTCKLIMLPLTFSLLQNRSTACELIMSLGNLHQTSHRNGSTFT